MKLQTPQTLIPDFSGFSMGISRAHFWNPIGPTDSGMHRARTQTISGFTALIPRSPSKRWMSHRVEGTHQWEPCVKVALRNVFLLGHRCEKSGKNSISHQWILNICLNIMRYHSYDDQIQILTTIMQSHRKLWEIMGNYRSIIRHSQKIKVFLRFFDNYELIICLNLFIETLEWLLILFSIN